MRRLQSSRRVVPLDQVDDYLQRWALLRKCAHDAGGNAWLFRDPRREDHYMEFVEFSDSDDSAETSVHDARRDIDDFFGHAQVEEWEEAPEAYRDT